MVSLALPPPPWTPRASRALRPVLVAVSRLVAGSRGDHLTLIRNSACRGTRGPAGPGAGYRPRHPGAPPIPQWGPSAPCWRGRHPAPPAGLVLHAAFQNFGSGLTSPVTPSA